MNSTLILFKEIGRQLLIVGLVLGSLPMAIRILWKLRLLPLGCYTDEWIVSNATY